MPAEQYGIDGIILNVIFRVAFKDITVADVERLE
jgi:hypothetical protein